MITRYIDSPEEDGPAACEMTGAEGVATLAGIVDETCPLLETEDAEAGIEEMRVEC